ncbi:adenylate cyclase [Burkholderia ubonensis]|nr:adenylate cyclase [Burkholderia ubonensis]
MIERVKNKTGIVPKHLVELQRFAQEKNCVIGIRPVDPLATGLIESGHPTKGLHVKGKSASWGPQAGLICKDQRYSKLEGRPLEIAEFNKKTLQCIEQRDAVAVPLTICPARLTKLLEDSVIRNLSSENSEGISAFSAQGPSGQIYSFSATRKWHGGESVYEITHEGQPIEVLAPCSGAKPLTADYDLFVFGPHISDLGPQDNLSIPDVTHRQFRERLKRYHSVPRDPYLIHDYWNKDSFYRSADRDIGICSTRIRDMIPELNKALVGDGEPVVHHGADSANPEADSTANYPATFFLPTTIGTFDKVCIINDSRELTQLIRQAKDNGYHIPVNPLWETEVRTVRSSSYDEARMRIDAMLKRRGSKP